MKIVICDDSIEDMLKIEKLLKTYSVLFPDVHFVIEKYSDSDRLYRQIQERELADIYLLDMVMPRKNGIDIAALLRKLGSESVVIYITSSDDFALESYQVHAVRYLLKPVSLTGLPKSQKGKNHDLGMQSVSAFADKTGGNIGCFCEDGIFQIMLFAKFQVIL